MNAEAPPKKPGSGLIAGGLFLAGIALFLIVVVLSMGGSLTPVTAGAFLLGLLLAAIGFGRRVLAALESR